MDVRGFNQDRPIKIFDAPRDHGLAPLRLIEECFDDDKLERCQMGKWIYIIGAVQTWSARVGAR